MRDPSYRVDDDYSPPNRTPTGHVLTVEPCVVIDLTQLTMNFDRIYTRCVHKLYHNRTSQSAGAGIRAAFFSRCKVDTVVDVDFGFYEVLNILGH